MIKNCSWFDLLTAAFLAVALVAGAAMAVAAVLADGRVCL